MTARPLTYSEIASYRRCQRHHANRYVQLRRPLQTTRALAFGTYFHAALETLDNGGEPTPYVVGDPFERVTAECLLIGYQSLWPRWSELLASEVKFATPLVNPDTGYKSTTFHLAGAIDAIVRHPRDEADAAPSVWVVERKTTSEDISPGSDYWTRLAIDTQIAIYLVGAKALGWTPAGVIYDVARKPLLRPYQATPPENRKYKANGELYANQRAEDETPGAYRERLLADIGERPEFYYGRQLLVRDEREQIESARDVWQTATTIREALRFGRAPRNPDSCLRWGRPCEYFDVCAGVATIDDDGRFRTATTQHEELQP